MYLVKEINANPIIIDFLKEINRNRSRPIPFTAFDVAAFLLWILSSKKCLTSSPDGYIAKSIIKNAAPPTGGGGPADRPPPRIIQP